MVIFLNEYVVYKRDIKRIIYKVINKNDDLIELQGLNFRKKIIVNASEVETADNLSRDNEEKNNNLYFKSNLFRVKNKKCLLGTVLHIDADKDYLQRCLDFYKTVGIYCYPVLCEASEVYKKIYDEQINFTPDVVVITGHDLFNGKDKKDLKNYSNSKYYIKAIKIVKEKYPNSVIIAGACQSHFEALLASGADFASSPKRINVHVYDPAIIAINVCTTSVRNVVDFNKMEKYITELRDSFGGIETHGKMKMLY